MTTRAEQSMSMLGVMTVAAAAGAVFALLFAPRSGTETRDQIKLKMHQAKQASDEKMEMAKSKAKAGMDSIKGKAEETSTEIGDAAVEARSQVEDVAAETRARSRRGPTPTV